MEMRSRFDSLWIGLSVGVFIPFLALVMFYYSSFTKVSFNFFIEYSSQIRVLPKVISLCVIPNLGVFFLFMWRNHYHSSRGIIMATLIITFLVLGLKIFI
jgi:hypothetical protein